MTMRFGILPPLLSSLVVRAVSVPVALPSSPVLRTFTVSAALSTEIDANYDNLNRSSSSPSSSSSLDTPRVGVGRVQLLRQAISSKDATMAATLFLAVRESSIERDCLKRDDYIALLKLSEDASSPSSPRKATLLSSFARLSSRERARPNAHKLLQKALLEDMDQRGFLYGVEETTEIAEHAPKLAEELVARIVRRVLLANNGNSSSNNLDAARTFLNDISNRIPASGLAEAYLDLVQALLSSGDVAGAVAVFETRRQSGMMPTGRLYATMINVAARLGDGELSKSLWRDSRDLLRGPERTAAWNTLLATLASHGNFAEALKMFRSVVSGRNSSVLPDIRSYQVMMRHAPNARGAMDILNLLLDNEMEPDVVILADLIAAWCNEGNLAEAWRLALTMKTSFGVDPDETVFLNLYSGLAKRGDVASVRQLLDRMRALGIKPHAPFYAAALRIQVEARNDSAFEATVQQMEQDGVSKDEQLYILIAGHYLRRWDLGKLDALVDEFRKAQMSGSLRTAEDHFDKTGRRFFETLLRGYRDLLGVRKEASPRLAELHEDVVRTGVISFHKRVVVSPPSNTPDEGPDSSTQLESSAASLRMLYDAASEGDLARAKHVFSRINKPDLTCWNWLLVAHAWAHDVPGIHATLAEMESAGISPDSWTWSIQAVSALLRNGEELGKGGGGFESAALDRLLANKETLAEWGDSEYWADRVGHVAAAAADLATSRQSCAVEGLTKLASTLRDAGVFDFPGSNNVILAVRRIAVGLAVAGDAKEADRVYRMLPERLKVVMKDVFSTLRG